METGKEKFLRFIAGHMIIVRMEESLFPRQNLSGKMKPKGISMNAY
jgi:hypothetical protein